MMNHPPIPITELAEHTELLKANDNLKLSQEYEVSSPRGPGGGLKVMLAIDFCPTRLSLPRDTRVLGFVLSWGGGGVGRSSLWSRFSSLVGDKVAFL